MTDAPPPLDARITQLTPQATAAIRVRRPMSELDLPALFDEQLPLIAQRIADLGAGTAGPPYARYHEWGDTVDVEVGIPVTRPLGNVPPLSDAREGELGSSDLPGGEAAIALHVGPYDGLSRTYELLHDWIHGTGRDEGPAPWESYVDDPAEVADPNDLRTEVIWPLR